jgi:hypothetical protein
MAAQGMEAAGGSPEDFAARIKSDIDAMSIVIRDAGLKLK